MNSGDHNTADFDFDDFADTCMYAERERSVHVGDSHHNDTHGECSCVLACIVQLQLCFKKI